MELSGIYLFLGYTGGRSGEFVDNEKQPLNDGSLEEIFGRKAQEDDDSEDQACVRQLGCPSSRDQQRRLIVMAVKLVHHKGEDRKPRPTILCAVVSRHVQGDLSQGCNSQLYGMLSLLE